MADERGSDREKGRARARDGESARARGRERAGPPPGRRLREELDDDDLVGPRTVRGARPPRAARPPRDEYDDGDELVGRGRVPAPRLRRGSRAVGDRETLKALVRDIPNFVKLLGRLARDPRVSAADKAIVVGAIAYVLVPADIIPEWIPGIGEIDDVFVLALAISRLLNNAGIEVLLDHWDGEVSSLETALDALERASSILPERVRALLGKRR
jgi:uncharacterized membrane protein YkvA (DUF1232 family)